MKMNEYQEAALKTAIFSDGIHRQLEQINQPAWARYLRISYCVGKLNGEAGELQEIISKALRDGYVASIGAHPGSKFYDPDLDEKIIKELGDIYWYAAVLADELGRTMDDVAKINLDKLASRQERGALGGSGDNR